MSLTLLLSLQFLCSLTLPAFRTMHYAKVVEIRILKCPTLTNYFSVVFSYASSSTLHPRQWVSQWPRSGIELPGQLKINILDEKPQRNNLSKLGTLKYEFPQLRHSVTSESHTLQYFLTEIEAVKDTNSPRRWFHSVAAAPPPGYHCSETGKNKLRRNMIESKAWKRERGGGAPLEMFPSLSWQCPAPGLGWNSPHPGNLLKSRSQAQILTLSKRLKISFASSIMAVLAESA